jgi:HK97 family phage portal protein
MQLFGLDIKRSNPAASARSVRSIENPSTSLSNPDAWLYDAFGSSSNGVSVSAKSVLGIPAYAAAVGRRARTIGSLSCKVFKKTELGTEPDYEHPLYNLLNRQPHPLYNSFIFFQTLVTNLDTRGVAYARIIRNRGTGEVSQLELVEPANVVDLQKTGSGNYFYIVNTTDTMGRTERKTVALGDMVVLKGLTFDGFTALNPVQQHKATFSGGLSSKEYVSKFYENGAHINYAVEVPFEMSPTAKSNFESTWQKLFSGIRNAFRKPFILDKGAKLHPLKMTPADAQMTESNRANVEDMARIADVPAHMVGAGENMTFSSVEVMVTDFVQYSLRNTIRQLEMELENKCLSRAERDGRTHEIHFNLDSLLQGDIKTRTEKGINEIKWGLITVNEYRRLNGYNEIQGGDVLFNPINMFVTKEGETPVNPAFEQQPTQQ